MSNIYFPDEEVTYNDLYFVCFMIERTARHLKQPNAYVVHHLNKRGLERQLSIAATNHCLNPDQVVADWIDEYNLQSGNTDVTKVDARFADVYPTDLQMGKVYARLVHAVAQQNDNLADTLMKVYDSEICEVLDNYNTGAYYEPSYVQTRAFWNGGF